MQQQKIEVKARDERRRDEALGHMVRGKKRGTEGRETKRKCLKIRAEEYLLSDRSVRKESSRKCSSGESPEMATAASLSAVLRINTLVKH